MKSIMLALALSLGLAGSASAAMTKLEADGCRVGEKNIPFAKLEESWGSDGAKALAAQYGVLFVSMQDKLAQRFIALADVAVPDEPYPGTIEKITRIVVFSANPEKLSKSRVFIYGGDNCLMFQLDWSSKLVASLLNDIAKENI